MTSSVDLDAMVPVLRGGDRRAFGSFMAAAELPLRRSLAPFAARIDLEAVVQETFLRVWQVLPRLELDGQRNALLRFTLRVGKNLALDTLKRRREELGVEIEELPDPTPTPTDPMLRELIVGCFDKLPPQPGAALGARLRSAAAEPDKELAEQCHMRLNTFLQNVTRARKLLIACLEQAGVSLGQVEG